MSMKVRLAALALAVAFVAAPALAAIAHDACPPCMEPESDAGPCSSHAAITCCGGVASTAPAKSTEAPSLQMVVHAAVSVAAVAAAPPAVHELAYRSSPQRLSVVRRL